jgi:hypothetical protein
MKPTPPERIRLYFSHAKQEWLVSHQCNDTPDKPEYVLASKLDSALARIEWFIQQLDIEQGAAKAAQDRLHSVRLFIDTPHPHWGQGEVLDGVREILDGVVERQEIK